MSPEFPQNREPPTAFTWWVGRGPKPRAWWRDGVFPVMFAAWLTISYLLSPDRKGTWVPVAMWVFALADVAWLYRCHRTGRDPRDSRLERWTEEHRVWRWSILAAVAVLAFLLFRII